MTTHPKAFAHDSDFREVFPDVFVITGGLTMPMAVPMRISRNMTVVRDDGELTLVNTMRLNEEGLAKLDALGKVSRVIRIGCFHGRDDGFYRDRYGAKLYAIEGQFYSRALDAKRPDKNYLEPDAWLTEDSALPLAGASLKIFQTSTPPEAALLLARDGGILITADSLQHTPKPNRYNNIVAKIGMRVMGFFKPHAVGAGWLQFAKPEASDVRSVLDLEFVHVIPGHGDPVIGDAKSKYRASVMGPLKGCHE